MPEPEVLLLGQWPVPNLHPAGKIAFAVAIR
jgi:hypothetical protein